jgi:hypothetical protein
MKKKNSLTDLFGSSQLLAGVLTVLKTKQFIDVIHPYDGEYSLLGKLSPLERAIYTVLIRPVIAIDNLGSCSLLRHPVTFDCINMFKAKGEKCPFANQLTAIRNEFPPNALTELLHELIHSRLNVMELDLPDIRLCPDFLIVTSKKDVQSQSPIQSFETIDSMSMEEMLEVSLKGTFLGPIFEIINSGKFYVGKQALESRDVVVRDMTLLEKGFWTRELQLVEAYDKATIELQELYKGNAFIPMFSLFTLSSEGISGPSQSYLPTDPEHADAIKATSLEREINKIKTEVKIVDDFMWEIIMSGIPKDTLDAYTSQGIRKKFKIVVYNKEQS